MVRYESLEEALADSKGVTELDLSEQELEELSAEIGQLTHLQRPGFNPDENADRGADHLH
jgi:Leucine-rich repeat (LRR) protein